MNRHGPDHTRNNNAGVPDPSQLNQQQHNQFQNMMDMARQFEGKSQQELLQEAMRLASQGKQDGSLTDEKMVSFIRAISPNLNSAQRAKLEQILRMMGGR